MSEMIERVARSLQAETSRQRTAIGYPIVDTWDDMSETVRELRRQEARAAIEALRDPTEAMVRVYIGVDDDGMTICRHHERPDVWRAMIDAALADPR